MAQRFLPVVQALGRGLVYSKSELFISHGQKAYNSQNYNYNGPSLSSIAPNEWKQNITSAFHNENKTNNCNISSKCLSIIKEFKDNENEHAHSVLRSLPAYEKTTVTRTEQHSNLLYPINQDSFYSTLDSPNFTHNDIANKFIEVSKLCQYHLMDLESDQYYTLCYNLSCCLPYLNDDTLLNILKSLSLWPPTSTTTTPNFMRLWNALDNVTTKRMRYWNIEKLFLVADHWYALRLSRISKFNTEMVKILGGHVTKMSPSQLVQYLFYANLGRELSPFIVMKDLEKQLLKSMNKITVDELGVIAMGFFKTQTFPTNTILLENILEKTKDNLHCVSEPSLGAILKLLRRSIPVSHWSGIMSLMDALNDHVDHLNHMCLLQIALLGNDLLVFHPEVIGKITQRFAIQIEDIRLKDLERLAFVLMLYNFIPPQCPNVLEIITEELRKPERKNEIMQYPRCFMSCIVYLVTMGHFPHDLMSTALHPDLLKQLDNTVNYNNIDREINELDWSIQIEAPQYEGCRIDDVLRQRMTKKYLGRLPSERSSKTHQERLVLEVRDKLAVMLGGDNFVDITFVLPHNQNPDIIFCTNKLGEPVPLPQSYLNQPLDFLKVILEEQDLEWNAVIVGGRNSFIRNTDTLRGTIQMKKRQMSKLGYNVAVLPFMKFSKKNLFTKMKCLEQILEKDTSVASAGLAERSFAILQNKK